MKTKRISILSLTLLAVVVFPAIGQNRVPERPNPRSDVSAVSRDSDLRAANNNAAGGLLVTVSADSWSGSFVTYKSGPNFVVIVPQANVSAINWAIKGKGLGGVQVEQRGDDVFVILKINSDAPPSVEQKGNHLDIFFGGSNTVPDTAHAVPEPQTNSGSGDPGAVTTPPANPADNVVSTTNQPPVANAPVNLAAGLPQGNLGQTLLGLLQKNTTADALNLDLSVPESPAFTVLGLNPQTVVRPATPQEFASSLINGLDENGNFQNGLALDTAPYMLFNGENVKIRDYMEQYVTRLLSRTQFSFAAVKGASEQDLSTRLAAGLNITLWDRGDPRIYRPGQEGDVLDCFVRNLDTNVIIPPDIDPDDEVAVRNFVALELARLKPLADTCRAEGRKARWNRSAWTIAYAPSWISKTGNSSGFKWNGGALWTSLAYGFEEMPSLKKVGQLIFHARYRTKEQIADEDNPGNFLTQNSLFFGARFRAGSPKFGFNIEDGFLRTRTLGGPTDTSNRFSVGAELRLTDNIYFVLSTGGTSGRADGKSNGFVMTSFKYGFNKKAQFNPQPQ